MQTTSPVRTVAVLGTYIPRLCGLATFTSDLTVALSRAAPDVDSWAMAMNDRGEGYAYPDQVRFEVHQDRLAEYRQAAEFLEHSHADVLCLQHEFGIFGGPAGRHILQLLRDVHLPLVTTLHTVLCDPNADQRAVLDELAARSDRLVVMSERAASVLQEVYRVPAGRIAVIPHGIPDVPFMDPNYFKQQLGVEGRTVILTFGLLSAGKGIEYMIEALPDVVRAFPDVVYVVLGATHPHVLAHEGEAYRERLQELARTLGVEQHVRFHNRFVPLEELCTFLGAAELYVTPYLGAAQASSGTLAYALGSGNAVISTPYWVAEELLADGRGLLTPFRDSQTLAENVLSLLHDRTRMHAMRKLAYAHTRSMVWSEVARRFLKLFAEVKVERFTRPFAEHRPRRPALDPRVLPPIAIDHLLALTDDTGIYQHARLAIPQRAHGYCTDDNARALLVAVRAPSALRPKLNTAAVRYASFLEHALHPDSKRFRNFMTYDRQWTEDVGSDDCHGRAVWALGEAIERGTPVWLFGCAIQLFQEAIGALEQISSPHALALAAPGLHAYLRRFPGDRSVRKAYIGLVQSLHAQFLENEQPGWQWPEEMLTYDNARMPLALLQAGRLLEDPTLADAGLRMLDWLMEVQISPEGHFMAIGNRGWYPRGGRRARFDQQPLEAHASLDACLEAFALTGDTAWRDRAHACFGWFLGHNDLRTPLVDLSSGGCRDGLHGEGANQNLGAESTLAWMLSLMAMHEAMSGESSSHPDTLEALLRQAPAPVIPVRAKG